MIVLKILEIVSIIKSACGNKVIKKIEALSPQSSAKLLMLPPIDLFENVLMDRETKIGEDKDSINLIFEDESSIEIDLSLWNFD